MCLGNHEVDILVLVYKMRQMHHIFETIPQYIDALDKAQKQAYRAEIPIANDTLIMMANKSMLENERYSKADYVWEDLSKKERNWSKWK